MLDKYPRECGEHQRDRHQHTGFPGVRRAPKCVGRRVPARASDRDRSNSSSCRRAGQAKATARAESGVGPVSPAPISSIDPRTAGTAAKPGKGVAPERRSRIRAQTEDPRRREVLGPAEAISGRSSASASPQPASNSNARDIGRKNAASGLRDVASCEWARDNVARTAIAAIMCDRVQRRLNNNSRSNGHVR